MNKLETNINTDDMGNSFRNAHILNEFSKILQNLGSDLENSVSLFDSIQEKDEVFKKFETMVKDPIVTLMDFNSKTQKDIYRFVYQGFLTSFSEHKDKFNFIHSSSNHKSSSELIFFLSLNDEEFQESLFNLEYDYAMSDLAEKISLSFCFLEEDMEEGLTNTKKIELNNA